MHRQGCERCPQAITSRPEVVAEAGNPPSPFLCVATGRCLHADDVADVSVQSVYAIEDPLTTTAYSDPRTEFRKLKITTTGGQLYAERDQKTTSGSTVACTAPGDSGWYVDLPVSGERVNVDMRLTRPAHHALQRAGQHGLQCGRHELQELLRLHILPRQQRGNAKADRREGRSRDVRSGRHERCPTHPRRACQRTQRPSLSRRAHRSTRGPCKRCRRRAESPEDPIYFPMSELAASPSLLTAFEPVPPQGAPPDGG